MNEARKDVILEAFSKGIDSALGSLKEMIVEDTLNYQNHNFKEVECSKLSGLGDKLSDDDLIISLDIENCPRAKSIFIISREIAFDVTAKLLGTNEQESVNAELQDVLSELLNMLTNPILGDLSNVATNPIVASVPMPMSKAELISSLESSEGEMFKFSFDLMLNEKSASVFILLSKDLFV